MSMTSEMFTNIKMVKLYSWTDVILSIINKRRNKELSVLKKKMFAQSFLLVGFYLFPGLLLTSSLVLYVVLGN